MVSVTNKQAEARELKHRVLTCLHKLSDRDTHATAASELESIARSLSSESLPLFLSSISATDSSDKSPVRRQCVRLISLLSEHHGNSLSPYLSKLLSAIIRRLRDPDSSVRSACIAASLSLASHLTSPPFTTITKPFLEFLFIQQDPNNQTGAALCLSAIVEGSTNPDAAYLRKLLPRLEKLAKCESFKAKAALLALIGSVVSVRGAIGDGGKNEIKNLLMCLTEFLVSEDWTARKAAAEAITKMAYAEKALLLEYKVSCLKTFEAKRFDKVKAVREAMNQMIEAWKEIPDLPEELPLPMESPASSSCSKEIATDGDDCKTPGIQKNGHQLDCRVPYSASSARRRLSLDVKLNVKDGAMFRRLESKKPSDCNIEPRDSNDSGPEDDGEVEEASPPEDHEATRIRRSQQKDFEDISLIRNHLLQIEDQQARLLDLFQRFMGSSQTGIQSLEARVHGLELAIEEIVLDPALRMSHNNSCICCKLPVADFLSSKLWKNHGNSASRVEPRPHVRFSTNQLAAIHGTSDGLV